MTNFELKKNVKISLNINSKLYEIVKKHFKSDRYLKKTLNSSSSFADLIECLLILYLNKPIETLSELNFDKYIYTYKNELLIPCKNIFSTTFKKPKISDMFDWSGD